MKTFLGAGPRRMDAGAVVDDCMNAGDRATQEQLPTTARMQEVDSAGARCRGGTPIKSVRFRLPCWGNKKGLGTSAKPFSNNGAQRRNRTTDTGIFNPLLYRLSYLGNGRTGLDPSEARIKPAHRARVKRRGGFFLEVLHDRRMVIL
jgi:hypothetical protein